MKKILTVLLCFCFRLVPSSVLAETKEISFVSPDGLLFETTYSMNEYYLETSDNNDSITYSVYDLSDNFVESWEFEKSNLARNSELDTSSLYRHINRKAIGALSGNLVHEVTLWASRTGSFGQFDSFGYDIFSIENWSYFSVGQNASTIKPDNNKWPTTRVGVGYTCIVLAKINAALEAQCGSELINAGFTLSTDFTYSKSIQNSYYISVY